MKVKKQKLTRSEVLERMREIWEILKLNRAELSNGESELIDMNFRLITLYCNLQETREFIGSSAIGFSIDDLAEEE